MLFNETIMHIGFNVIRVSSKFSQYSQHWLIQQNNARTFSVKFGGMLNLGLL